MENIPTPYQRQRRASRLPEQQAQVSPSPVQAAPAPVQADSPAVTPVPQARTPVQGAYAAQPTYPAMQQWQTAYRQSPAPSSDAACPPGFVPQQPGYTPPQAVPYPGAPASQPRAAQPAEAPQPVRGLTPAHPLPQPTGNRQPRALQQRAAASSWSMPSVQPRAGQEQPVPPRTTGYRSAPAGERPHAGVNGRRGVPGDGAVRRHSAPQKEPRRQPRESAPAAPAKPSKQRVEKRKTPSWLLTLLSLMLIGVMALVAFDFLMQAYLKTTADEKQAAYESILSNYHITEQENGTLRVTWQDLIEKYSGYYNLEPAFVTAVIRNESSFRTNAESSVGARGLMQMMPDTAEWVAGKLNDSFDFDRLYEAETSIRYGCWYLNYLSELFRGDPVLVAAAYHAGQGEVWGWLGDSSISPDGATVPIENIPISNTKTYAGRVTQAYGIYQTLLYPEISQAASELDDGAASVYATAVR